MEKPKFTDGEWNVLRDGFGGLYIDEHSRTVVIAQVCVESPTEEDEANAKLIAAAPKLLRACLFAYVKLTSIGEYNCEQTAKILDNAIKKATE